jgi:hypothetical protein
VNTRTILYFICLLISPLPVIAGEQAERRLTSMDEISFAPSSKAAFDHSGARISSKVLVDGSIVAEHNGSLGNVTVARLGADGRLETFCTTDEDAAKSWMAGGEPGSPDAVANITLREK